MKIVCEETTGFSSQSSQTWQLFTCSNSKVYNQRTCVWGNIWKP